MDRHRLPEAVEEELSLTYCGDGDRASVKEMAGRCDVVTLNCPLRPDTERMFDADMLGGMRRGAYLVNTARGKLCVREDVAAALESGQLAGYAGDAWFPQPAPEDHPWRSMPWHAMTPHMSGATLAAQARCAAGVRETLECWLDGKPIREEYLVMQDGKLAGVGAHAYAEAAATGGAAEAAEFKKAGGNA